MKPRNQVLRHMMQRSTGAGTHRKSTKQRRLQEKQDLRKLGCGHVDQKGQFFKETGLFFIQSSPF